MIGNERVIEVMNIFYPEQWSAPGFQEHVRVGMTAQLFMECAKLKVLPVDLPEEVKEFWSDLDPIYNLNLPVEVTEAASWNRMKIRYRVKVR